MLRIEAGGAATAAVWAGAVESACRKILEPLTGPGGAAALLGRAILLARRDIPDPEPVELPPDPSSVLAGPRAALVQLDPPKTQPAGTAILTNLIRLLIRLPGEDPGSQPVRKLWAHAFGKAHSSAIQRG